MGGQLPPSVSGVSSVRATGVLINCKLRDLDVWGDNCPLLCTGLVEPGKASQKPDRRYRTRCIFPVRMHVQVIFAMVIRLWPCRSDWPHCPCCAISLVHPWDHNIISQAWCSRKLVNTKRGIICRVAETWLQHTQLILVP